MKTLKIGKYLSITGFFLCLSLTASLFIFKRMFGGITSGLLFVGVFPLCFWTFRILQERMAGQKRGDWVPYMIQGLPARHAIFFRIYFFSIWAFCMVLILLEREGITVGFLLVPSVFYLISYYVFLSELALRGAIKSPYDNSVRSANFRA